MKIVYYLDLPTKEYLWMGRKSVMRARKHMPKAEIVLLTTDDFPDTDWNVDRVERLGPNMGGFYGYRKCKAQSTEDGDCLFLDVDCFVKKDVSHVFDKDFDAALCLRYMTKMVEKNPFNGGVAFSRNKKFWEEVAGTPDCHTSTVDTEGRFSRIAMNDKYDIKALNGDLYNYPPKAADDDLMGKYIVHYKGDRKQWLFPSAEAA